MDIPLVLYPQIVQHLSLASAIQLLNMNPTIEYAIQPTLLKLSRRALESYAGCLWLASHSPLTGEGDKEREDFIAEMTSGEGECLYGTFGVEKFEQLHSTLLNELQKQ